MDRNRRRTYLLLLAVLIIRLDLSSQQISPSLWKKIANIKNTNDFLEKMVIKNNDTQDGSAHRQIDAFEKILFDNKGSMTSSGREYVAGKTAPMGGCAPTEKHVTLPAHSDPAVFYFPKCTVAPQCGGCCGHEMLSCVPTKEQVKTLQVLQVRHVDPNSEEFVYEGMADVQIDVHHECECQCKTQAHHCSPEQVYLPDQCTCVCPDTSGALACSTHKRWDSTSCRCACIQSPRCFPNEYFNKDTCSCESETTPAPPTTTRAPCADVSCRPNYEARLSNGRCRCQFVNALIGGGLRVQPVVSAGRRQARSGRVPPVLSSGRQWQRRP